MSSNSNIIEELRNAVVNLDVDSARATAEEAVRLGVNPVEAIENGLSKGIREIGDKFEAGEAFVMELVLAAEAMKAGIEVFRPLLAAQRLERKATGIVVIGTVRGDIHDMGKNLVIVMLEAAGFDVKDLGVDVPPERFLEKVKEEKPHIIAMSSLLTTSAPEQKIVVDALEKNGIRRGLKVAVGGAAVTPKLAKEMGADGYSDNAVDSVAVFKQLMSS
ncbi:MAG: corrinoid protein [Candidatus Bathyarchaeia archaeon]